MIRNIIALLSVTVFATACTDASSKATSATENSSDIRSEIELSQIDLFDQESVDNSKTYCSGEVSVYTQNGWVISASDDWRRTNRNIPNTDLALVNQVGRLLFTTTTSNVDGDVNNYVNNYVNSIVKNLQSTGVQATVGEKTNINGIEYYQISAPGNNFANWQWVTTTGNTVTVLACGAPKGTNADYDYCLDVVEFAQKL